MSGLSVSGFTSAILFPHQIVYRVMLLSAAVTSAYSKTIESNVEFPSKVGLRTLFKWSPWFIPFSPDHHPPHIHFL